MLKRSGFVLAAMIAVVGCGSIKIPVGETNVRVGGSAGENVTAPITNGSVDRVIGSPVSLDRGSPVSLDGVTADQVNHIGADSGSWSLKGAKLSSTATSVQGVKTTAAGTLDITVTIKLKFYQNDADASTSCSAGEVYTAVDAASASAQVDAAGNISDLSAPLSQANLNNMTNAIKVIYAKTQASKVAGATPWKMLACLSGNVNFNGAPVANGSLVVSGFDLGLGLYYSL
jgi:hypothetical protein